MAAPILSKKSVCIVTGATRGLGRSIALSFSKSLPSGSLLILLSRNIGLLNEVVSSIHQRDGIRAVAAAYDQGSRDENTFDSLISHCMGKAEALPDEFEQSILINNAGTLEPIDFMRDLDNTAEMSNYFQINLVGCLALTAKFLQFFKSSVTSPRIRIIVNISSLAAISPMNSWGLYCMAKAARDMMLKVLASEEENIRTLNYAPGPLPTDMLTTASEKTKDLDLKKWFEEQIAQKTLVDCDDSTRKLMAILDKNTFENGSHVDYYDEI
ncbi:sepiapterin reductase [Elysia marginata]|uniref:Sepiapterin reductase n=1 Tax=Elysia marginata TaxID=1093978 RepID=A0AAV4F6Q7_9GAST|nr:sepiapterin reductase [Elysia marginata]